MQEVAVGEARLLWLDRVGEGDGKVCWHFNGSPHHAEIEEGKTLVLNLAHVESVWWDSKAFDWRMV